MNHENEESLRRKILKLKLEWKEMMDFGQELHEKADHAYADKSWSELLTANDKLSERTKYLWYVKDRQIQIIRNLTRVINQKKRQNRLHW